MIKSETDIEILDKTKAIGEGAFSKVYKCRLRGSPATYALKIVN